MINNHFAEEYDHEVMQESVDEYNEQHPDQPIHGGLI